MWVDTPQFSTALQAQPFESGGLCCIYVLFLFIYSGFLQNFSKIQGHVGRKSLSERWEPILIYVTCHHIMLVCIYVDYTCR